MANHPVVILGFVIPRTDPYFLVTLAVHVPFAFAAVVTGLGAMLIHKGPGRHPQFGTVYFWCLAVVWASAFVLAVMRWTEDFYLLVLGSFSFVAAFIGREAHKRRWTGWVRLHITGMGTSYLFLMIAFYMDNGKNLPVWKDLPQVAYWLLPTGIGLPILIWALRWHPLVRLSGGQK